MIMLTFKNPVIEELNQGITSQPKTQSEEVAQIMMKMGKENSDSTLLDAAIFHHRTNSILLCLLGLTAKAK